MWKCILLTIFSVVSLVVADTAEAHTGLTQDGGFAAWLVHPLLGIDHLIATLAVGIYAGQYAVRVASGILSFFLMAVGIGMVAAFAGFIPAAWDIAVAVTMLATGVALMLNLRFGFPWLVGLAVVFGLIQGHSHGVEMAYALPAWIGGFGMMVSTLLLLAAACSLGRIIALSSLFDRGWTARGVGGAVSAASLFFTLV